MTHDSRVILLSHGFQPEYEAGFANGLARNGLSVVLIGSDMTLTDRLDAGVALLNLRGSQDSRRSRWSKGLNMIQYWCCCYGYVLRNRGTPVHMIGTFSTGNLIVSWAEAWLTRLLAGQYVLTVHNLMPHDAHSSLNHRLCRSIYRTAAVCMVHTARMRSALISEFGIAADHVVIVEHGIDRMLPASTSSRESMRLRLGVSDTEKLILFFGNLAPYKGVDIRLDAFDTLASRLKARLLIAGRCRSDSLKASIHKKIAASDSSSLIQWLDGYFPEAEVEPLFHAADVLAMPYRHIDQSGVIFMALATGLRVVASDVGSLRDYIPRELGEVVPAGDAMALANSMESVLSDVIPRMDPSALARSYMWSLVVAPMLPVYLRLNRG